MTLIKNVPDRWSGKAAIVCVDGLLLML